ncbi:hypothetical protein C0993_008272 [Termitomyces sp. T159_Od127]|nr:hypothetical protein C0993_008272 [Termitomyces sp. T159_Od127]
MGKLRGNSISRMVCVHNPRAPFKNSSSSQYSILARVKERERAQEQYKQNIQGRCLSGETLQTLAEIQGISRTFKTEPDPVNHGSNEWEDIIPDAPDDSIAQAARDLMDSRLQWLQSNWSPLMERLADAYLAWKYSVTAPLLTSMVTSDPNSVNAPTRDNVTQPNPTSDTDSVNAPNYDFTINVVDIYTLNTSTTIHRTEDSLTATALVLQGYLGTTPEQPTLALSLRTLELYHRIRWRKPSFSIEAFAKVLCDSYILEGKPHLKFSHMITIDGNNSLKRIGPFGERQVGDTRTFDESDYYLDREFVDQYADEVKKSTRPSADSTQVVSSDGDNDGALSDEDQCPDNNARDLTDGASSDGATHTPCAENWKAAAAKSNKKMWAIFEETGIFVGACHHGLILWIMDMLRSGELAKYGLAFVTKALKVLAPKFLLGYDIGCVFEGTIDRSSLSGSFKELGCRCCINTFHGYSHNFLCQVQHHSNVIEGMGLEDLETLERVFSSSDQLASVTRYMSKHCQRVFIDLFFCQWDEEKYKNLATMIYNNYRQALRIINVDGPELERAKQELILGKEPEGHALKIAYVERLKELRDAEEKYKTANNLFLIATPDDVSKETYALALSITCKRETKRCYANER